MLNHSQSPTLVELKQRSDIAFAEAQEAIDTACQIVKDAKAVRAEMLLASAEYQNMVRLGARCLVRNLPQVRAWDENRDARQTTFLLALAK